MGRGRGPVAASPERTGSELGGVPARRDAELALPAPERHEPVRHDAPAAVLAVAALRAAAGQVVVLAAAEAVLVVEVAPHGAERLPSHLAPDAAA